MAFAKKKAAKKKKEMCEYGKRHQKHDWVENSQGRNDGDSQALRRSIISNIEDHKWYSGPNSLAAHHLICSESVKEWGELCFRFNYNINRKNNGIMLPTIPSLSCHLGVPLHNDNHILTITNVEKDGKYDDSPPIIRISDRETKKHEKYKNYVNAVKTQIEEIKAKAESGGYCMDAKGKDGSNESVTTNFTKDMDKKSKFILNKIAKFTWTITFDGKHYKKNHPIGCGGTSVPTDKRYHRDRKDDTGKTVRVHIEKQIKGCRNRNHNWLYNRNISGKNNKLIPWPAASPTLTIGT